MNPQNHKPSAILDTEAINVLKTAFTFFVIVLALIAVGYLAVMVIL